MSDGDTLSLDLAENSDANTEKFERRPCPLCTRSFRPIRRNQIYCSPKHRRRALRIRQQAAELVGEKPRAGRTPLQLLQEVQAERRRRGLPPLQPNPFLKARARVLEALAQLERWEGELTARMAAVGSLPQPAVEAIYQPLQPGEPLAVPHEAIYCEVVGDHDVGYLVYALEHPSGRR